MAVEVIDDAVRRVSGREQPSQCIVVRRVKALDARFHFVDAQLASVNGAAVVERAPDQRLADACLAARGIFVRPAATLDQRQIDVAAMAIGIEVGARIARGEQRQAQLDGGDVKLVDEAVFAVTQVEFGDRGVEIRRELAARMR